MKEAAVKWQDGMAFLATTGTGFALTLDARPDVGGQNRGPRPSELVLVAFGGCTGMDTISILHKMRTAPTRLDVSVTGEEAEEHPKAFTRFVVRYDVAGEVPEAKLVRAIQLSRDRYCVVAGQVRPGAALEFYYRLNGSDWQPVPPGE